MLTLWGVGPLLTYREGSPLKAGGNAAKSTGESPMDSLQFLEQATPEASSLLAQIYEPISLCLFPLSHLSPSHEGHITMQGATCATSGPTGHIVVPRTLIQLRVSAPAPGASWE